MATFIYTHKADCDGVCSAAILERYVDLENVDSRVDFIDYGALAQKAFSRIEGLAYGSEVIIADFGCDISLLPAAERAISSLNKRGGKLVWLDHHKWDEESVRRLSPLAKVRLSKSDELCGAELSYLEYMGDDELSRRLAAIGRDSDIDMWKTNPPSPSYALTKPLADLITYYNYLANDDDDKRRGLLLSLVRKLSDAPLDRIVGKDFDNPFWDNEMQKDFSEYKKLETSKLEECLGSAETFKAGDYTFVIGISDRVLSTTTVGNALLNRYNADASFVVRETGLISIRRSTGRYSIKCDELAKLFSGGGHEYAAGGKLGYELKDLEAVKLAKSEIIKNVSAHYSA